MILLNPMEADMSNNLAESRDKTEQNHAEVTGKAVANGLPFRIYDFPITTSTNTLAREMLNCEETPFVVCADEQTGGRGRSGKSFVSPRGGLYLTLALSANEIKDSAALTVATAVCVCRALKKLGYTPVIKWVNDVLLANRKVCGILCESVTVGGNAYYLIGIGINCNTPAAAIPKELSNTIGSLKIDEIARKQLKTYILEQLKKEIFKTNILKNVLDEYRDMCMMVGRKVTFRISENSPVSTGTVSAITNECALSVLLDSGESVKLTSGVIEVEGLYTD